MRKTKRTRNKWKWLTMLAVICVGVSLGVIGIVLWNSYDGRVYSQCTFEAGSEVKAENFLVDISKEIEFVKDSNNIDTTVLGEYSVKLKSGIFTYSCTAIVQDTIAPSAEAVDVYYEEGQTILPEQFVTNVNDVTNVTISYEKEPDFSLPGKQLVEIVLTDEGGNQYKISSYLITRVTVSELTAEIGSAFPDLEKFLFESTEDAVFVTDTSSIDMMKIGEHEIVISAKGCNYTTKLSVVDTTPPVVEVQDVSVYIGENVTLEDFVVTTKDFTKVTYSYVSEPDMTKAGKQVLTIVFQDEAGNVLQKEVTLTLLEDTEPPVIKGIKDITIFEGDSVDYKSGVTVTDNRDKNVTFKVDDSAVDTSKAGSYKVIYSAVDASGNKVSQSITLTVKKDTTAPVIHGAKDITVFLGNTISYKSGITVTDNHDSKVSLKVDNSAVDKDKAGSYKVIYSAQDKAGNKTSVTITLTIVEKTYSEEAVRQLAKEVLDDIITSGMSQRQKLEAIYTWTRESIAYSEGSDKNNWVKTAYEGFTQRKGDCLTYASVAKAMFDVLGIENKFIAKIPARTKHYWNLVDIGEGWHHFDATPRKGQKISFCYILDADLMEYSNANNLSHNYDRSVYTNIC